MNVNLPADIIAGNLLHTPQRSHRRHGENIDRTPTGPHFNAVTSATGSFPSTGLLHTSAIPHASTPVGSTHLTGVPSSMPSTPPSVPQSSQMAYAPYPMYPMTPYWHGHYQWMSPMLVPSQYPQHPSYTASHSHPPQQFSSAGPSTPSRSSSSRSGLHGHPSSGSAQEPVSRRR